VILAQLFPIGEIPSFFPNSSTSSTMPSLLSLLDLDTEWRASFAGIRYGCQRVVVVGSGIQTGQAFTQSSAGTAFGLIRQTVERNVGLGTNRQIQFALRVNF
jgi:hypothetical protein